MYSLSTESAEIVIDLPFPPSTNRIWRHTRGRVYRAKEYVTWLKECDAVCLLKRQHPKERITGPFEFCLWLARKNEHGEDMQGDGDNFVKPVLDWLQSREIVANDKDCQEGHWKWVPRSGAPVGCRVFLTPYL